jgi:hypothetical protein
MNKEQSDQKHTTDASAITSLSAGGLSAVFDQGSLRYISYHGKEMVRAVAFFIRDSNWDTIPNQIEKISYLETKSGFELQYQIRSQQGSIDFHWDCSIRATSKQISFGIKGKASSDFKRNRLGFIVLHPRELAGKELEVVDVGNGKITGQFPESISPHQPFKDIKALKWQDHGIEAAMEFEGEIFEMEDQRNWLDASYKTYCTPLERPFPVQIKAGNEVKQKITINFSGATRASSEVARSKQLTINEGSKQLPEIGLGANSEKLDEHSIRSLRSLAISHLRAEARTWEDHWEENLTQQFTQAQLLDLPLELVVYSAANSLDQHLAAIKDLPSIAKVKISSLFAFDLSEMSTNSDYLEVAVSSAEKYLKGVLVGGGTDYYFTELNRRPPALDKVDFVTFSVQPQVHAFDDQSILETSQTFLDIGKSAKRIAGNKPVHISPITLKARMNPNATDPSAMGLNQQQRSDPRQKTILTALWALASLKYIAQSGIAQVTFFQTVGPEGLLDQQGSFPVFDVFSLCGKLKGFRLLETVSSHPAIFDGMVFRKESEQYYVLMNFTGDEQIISITDKTVTIAAKEIVVFDAQLNPAGLI